MSNKTAVVGVGNLMRGDDAAGVLAARLVGERLRDAVSVVESDGDLTALLECFAAFESVYLLDAVARRGKGRLKIHRFDGGGALLAAAGLESEFMTSSHAVGLRQAIELARALGRLPARLTIVGIEGREFGLGEGVSREVGHSIRKAAALVVESIRKEGTRDA